MSQTPDFITRFAPSPNGRLHMGHAYSALICAHQADIHNGLFVLRIEDIDKGRARDEFRHAIYDDLRWLGLDWPEPVMRQSQRFAAYTAALHSLREKELIYPCWATRGEIRRTIDGQPGGRAAWPIDPDGAPLYPGIYRDISAKEKRRLMWEGADFAWRLNMQKAIATIDKPLYFTEHCHTPNGAPRQITATPEIYGDIVLARKSIAASYHLAVVVDDAAQHITQVTRGRDLFAASHIHRLLQALLDLPVPDYYHHPLIYDAQGRRLSKQAGDGGFHVLREEGMSPAQLKALLPPLSAYT